MIPSTGAEARLISAPKYYTGKPCVYGHIADRYSHNGQCIECGKLAAKTNRAHPRAKIVAREYYERRRSESPEVIMWMSARSRARRFSLPFEIEPSDILAVWPMDGLCPIFKTLLRHNFDGTGGNAKDSPSLDRIIPQRGYIKRNIVVMSQKANMLKGDETDPEVFLRLAAWLEQARCALKAVDG